MSNIYNFYGDADDVLKLWQFINDLPGMRFVEVVSRNNVANQWFDSFPEELYRQKKSSSIGSLVAAWPSTVGGVPRQRIQRLPAETAIKLRNSSKSFLESPAFIEINTAPSPNSNYISPRELRYWTEKTARKYGKFFYDEAQNGEVDWLQLRQVTDQILSYIKKTSSARWNRKPILAGCAENLKVGSKKLWFWGQEGTL